MKLFSEANTLTKIANIVVAEDYKHDPMVYNPDEAKADVQEAHSMDYLDAMEALNKLVESGELEPRELSQIHSILSEADGDEGPDPFKEMSYEDDEDGDFVDVEDLDDEDDGDPHAWQYEEDESDLMSDYHGSQTVKTVYLAFSSHLRDLFPELRKASANFEETKKQLGNKFRRCRF
jgi:hypothetical protein